MARRLAKVFLDIPSRNFAPSRLRGLFILATILLQSPPRARHTSANSSVPSRGLGVPFLTFGGFTMRCKFLIGCLLFVAATPLGQQHPPAAPAPAPSAAPSTQPTPATKPAAPRGVALLGEDGQR